jgi:hypothetical protein
MGQTKVDSRVRRNTLANDIHNMSDEELDAFIEEGSTQSNRIVRAALRIKEDIPTIVCLCGSTRFYKQFQEAYFRETMAGKIVLSIGFDPSVADDKHNEWTDITPEKKRELDVLHKCKIALADEILVIDVDYIEESVDMEIALARKLERKIRYWSLETAR